MCYKEKYSKRKITKPTQKSKTPTFLTMIAASIAIILLLSEVVYPIVKKDSHPSIKSNSIAIQAVERVYYLGEMLFLGNAITNWSIELDKAVKSCRNQENNASSSK